MPNSEDNSSTVEKELDKQQLEGFQEEQNEFDIQDCVNKAIQQYLREHPCEGCMYEVLENLPDYTPPPEGAEITNDEARNNHLTQIATLVQSQIKKCRMELRKKKQRWNINRCLCILTWELAKKYEFDNDEMATIFGITKNNTVSKRLHRCLELLLEWRSQDKTKPDFKTCFDQIKE
ncbi:MAG: hypothetical protein VSS75_002700 [Candidatus Parabeggiatoa sp.]|nr:hypothetical protein [Candidatus Parabeggiatoa sp.]